MYFSSFELALEPANPNPCCFVKCLREIWKFISKSKKCFSKLRILFLFVLVLLIFLLPVIPMYILSKFVASFIALAELVFNIEFTPQTVNIVYKKGYENLIYFEFVLDSISS